jgi:hypothetical protein
MTADIPPMINTEILNYTTNSGNTFQDTEDIMQYIIGNYASPTIINSKQDILTIQSDTTKYSAINGTTVRRIGVSSSSSNGLTMSETNNDINIGIDPILEILSTSKLVTPLELNDYTGVTGNGYNELTQSGINSKSSNASIKISSTGNVTLNAASGKNIYFDRNSTTFIKIQSSGVRVYKNTTFSQAVTMNTDLNVTGTITVGTLNATNKNFVIPYPGKEDTKIIRHSCTEANVPLNMYRYVNKSMKNGTNYLALPVYWNLININGSVHISPVDDFCQWYASVEQKKNRINITTNSECVLDILVIGQRNDPPVQNFKDVDDKIIETIQDEDVDEEDVDDTILETI